MPIQVYLHTADRRQLGRRTSRGWDVDPEGWIEWRDRRYHIDPEYFERVSFRPIWHYMFFFPLFLFGRQERMSIHFNEGDPQPRNMAMDPVLDNLVTTGTAAAIYRIGKQTTVNDFTFPRKKDPLMTMLILSIAANVMLGIVLALRSIKL